jgi:hypothetical protein
MAASTVAGASNYAKASMDGLADRPVPVGFPSPLPDGCPKWVVRFANRGHGSRWLVPSTLRSAATPVLRSGSATEDGEGGRA